MAGGHVKAQVSSLVSRGILGAVQWERMCRLCRQRTRTHTTPARMCALKDVKKKKDEKAASGVSQSQAAHTH
jgi:hypothetical protein